MTTIFCYFNFKTQLITLFYFSEWHHCPSTEEARNLGVIPNFSLSFSYHIIDAVPNQLMNYSISFYLELLVLVWISNRSLPSFLLSLNLLTFLLLKKTCKITILIMFFHFLKLFNVKIIRWYSSIINVQPTLSLFCPSTFPKLWTVSDNLMASHIKSIYEDFL